ncbi:MAG: hypothetical protein JSU73_05800 [candidate division WOR-3 bacterium]|nr:MAG: hypothetical protein JSU73_05800 [candidate division WOR-3 bacterium]
MKKRLWILPLALVAVVGLFISCEQMWHDPMGRLPADLGSDPVKFDIVAGKDQDAGDILVWNSPDYVVVQTRTHDPWLMTRSRLDWAGTSDELPMDSPDHLAPGRFQHVVTHDPPVAEYTFEIPIRDLQPGNQIVIALNCDIATPDLDETGWGGSWQGCFTYVIREVDSGGIVRLPDYPVRMRAWHPWVDSNSFFKVELDSVGTGYSVWDGYWKGWCSEIDVEMPTDSWFTVTLISSEDDSLPYRIRVSSLGITRRWDCTNWLLNNRPDTATYHHIQSAMYYLLGEDSTLPGGLAGQMASDAITYGTGFRVSPGELISVVCMTPEDIQLCFIEVTAESDKDKDVKLPTYQIKARAWHPWMVENAFWKVELAGIDDTTEYNVWNGYWRGWCSEINVELYSNTWFNTTLLSSQADSLPDRARVSDLGITRRWDCVNWLLNNKPGNVNYYHIQGAMYYLLGEKATMPIGKAGQMASDAITYGTGYRSGPGDWVAVILLTPEDVQLCFIEVDP